MYLLYFILITIIITLVVKNGDLKNDIIDKEIKHAEEKFYPKYSGCDYDTLCDKYDALKNEIAKKKIQYGDRRFKYNDYIELCGRFLACKEWISRKEPEGMLYYSVNFDKFEL